MVGPQLVDNQAFIASKIMLASRRQKMAYDFCEHSAEGFGSVEVQAAVGMRPGRRCNDVTASGPFFVRHLIPTSTIDASLWALASGDHREVRWRDEVERRWAVASYDHVVIELKDMARTKDRLHVITNERLLPKGMAWMKWLCDPQYFSSTSRGTTVTRSSFMSSSSKLGTYIRSATNSKSNSAALSWAVTLTETRFPSLATALPSWYRTTCRQARSTERFPPIAPRLHRVGAFSLMQTQAQPAKQRDTSRNCGLPAHPHVSRNFAKHARMLA